MDLSAMKLLPISIHDEHANRIFLENSDCRGSLELTIDYFRRVGFVAPWIGYYVAIGDEFVGACGFKGPPKNGKAEIAYGTFDRFQHKGIGTEICRRLTLEGLNADHEVRITARTLPENNFSVSILKKNGFKFLGVVFDEDDGDVWEWEYERP